MQTGLKSVDSLVPVSYPELEMRDQSADSCRLAVASVS
jgi:hypothetical protein